ncbi:hypothetical protein QJS10_CPB13g00075 [Acorus calamus]|uniref:RRM domain-containing protein n=1 Tax=Acorus calamus TaxID=4465 RepID=A0AAV9DG18_ACOCL|nr:hypothetical protein QJS10_CPB13g00075 [Acorus calamus]
MESETKIYIGKLSLEVEEESLKEHFKVFGECLRSPLSRIGAPAVREGLGSSSFLIRIQYRKRSMRRIIWFPEKRDSTRNLPAYSYLFVFIFTNLDYGIHRIQTKFGPIKDSVVMHDK